MGVDLLDGLCEEVNCSEAEGCPESGDENVGFGEEHVERSLDTFDENLMDGCF